MINRKSLSNMRKSPTQERSLKTIEAIYEACTRIILNEGYEAVTTNKVADLAGVSIGTLYQYFPNKQSIVIAMIQLECKKFLRTIDTILLNAEQEKPTPDPKFVLRAIIRVIIQYLTGSGGSKQALAKLAWQLDNVADMHSALIEVATRIGLAIERIGSDNLRQPTTASIFVVTRSVFGTIRAACLEDSHLIGSQQLEDELVRLAWAMTSKDRDE